VTSAEDIELEVPEPALRIRYYHQDHLGSSAAMTDAVGELIEEAAFYPSGIPRYEHRLRSIDESYRFTQKERDRESGLHYFEARYLIARSGRFASIDPMYAAPDTLTSSELGSFLARPQELNLYAYAFNNPLRYNDPNGLDAKDKVAWGNDAAGAAAGAADEAALWNYRFNPSASSSGAPTALKVVGKSATVISVTWKTAEFINDPSEATGAQLANEGAKTLVSVAAPPVGLVWSILDLTGYGPSQTLEALDKSAKANRAAAKAYRQTAAIHRATTQMINERAPKIAAQQRHAGERLKVLKQETAKWNQKSLKALKGETRSLEELNAAIAKQEKANRRSAAQAAYWEAKARKLNAK
jgi:RHS repeat-associated protein